MLFIISCLKKTIMLSIFNLWSTFCLQSIIHFNIKFGTIRRKASYSFWKKMEGDNITEFKHVTIFKMPHRPKCIRNLITSQVAARCACSSNFCLKVALLNSCSLLIWSGSYSKKWDIWTSLLPRENLLLASEHVVRKQAKVSNYQ